jgi:CheY-like chemotaxis protein
MTQDLARGTGLAMMALAGGLTVLGFIPTPAQAEPADDDMSELARQLAHSVAHDINNLLTVLLLDAELVTDPQTSSADLVLLGHSMRTACREGADLTTLLLAYAGRQNLKTSPIDLAAALPEMRPRLERCLAAGGALSVQLPDRHLPIVVDTAALEAALCQLVTITGASGAPLRLMVSLGAADTAFPDGFTDITVSDSPQELRPIASEHRLRPSFSARLGGFHRGMALPAVDGFARQSGGALFIRASDGNGSEVTLRLPSGNAVEIAEHRPAVMPLMAARACPARVLVVDDNAGVRESLARNLRANGHQVVAARDIGQARLHLAEGVDVLVTDVVLGGAEGGVELGMEARNRDSSLALVFISGVMSSHQSGLLAGDDMASFLRKPVNTGELTAVLEGLLALRALRRGG